MLIFPIHLRLYGQVECRNLSRYWSPVAIGYWRPWRHRAGLLLFRSSFLLVFFLSFLSCSSFWLSFDFFLLFCFLLPRKTAVGPNWKQKHAQLSFSVSLRFADTFRSLYYRNKRAGLQVKQNQIKDELCDPILNRNSLSFPPPHRPPHTKKWGIHSFISCGAPGGISWQNGATLQVSHAAKFPGHIQTFFWPWKRPSFPQNPLQQQQQQQEQ